MSNHMQGEAGFSAGYQRSLMIKRVVDIVLGGTLLIATAPLLAVAAVAIALKSGLPILYDGKRWGINEKPFTCYKLRTMRLDQDEVLKQRGLTATALDGRTLVHEDDPRIDAVGAFLRKYSIDELPQLFNVLRGDMSLIGPRALAISMLDRFPETRRARCVVKPGISGLWQVRNRRKNAAVMDMIPDDMEYIRTFSLALDMRIALKTFGRIVEPALDQVTTKTLPSFGERTVRSTRRDGRVEIIDEGKQGCESW